MVLTRLGIVPPRAVDHADLRQLAVDSLLCVEECGTLSVVMDGINNYIADMAMDRSWADGIVIPVLAKALGITIVLIDSDSNKPTVIDGIVIQVGEYFQSATGEPNAQMIWDMPTRRSMALRQHDYFPSPPPQYIS